MSIAYDKPTFQTAGPPALDVPLLQALVDTVKAVAQGGAGSGLDADTLRGLAPDDIAMTDAEIIAAVKRVDGPGSGLDADMLDGLHSSDFAPRLPGLMACSDPDANNDDLIIYDASAAAHKKVKPSQIQPTSVGYATKAGDGAASSNIRIPTSQPTSLANGDIWLV